MENLRQSCIHLTYKNENTDKYWNYMINFSDTCADPNNPIFTEDCALDIMKLTNIDVNRINECMSNAVNSLAGIIETDYNSFQDKKINKFPTILLNGVKYNGSWLAKYIFDSICSGFLDDEQICAVPKPTDLAKEEGLTAGVFLLIITITVFVMLIMLICYRRIVNKSLEASLNEKIQTQTIHSLGQYQVFKDESTGRKSVDITKL